ncbi:chorismate synthase [[Clostridium] fimetarium]|uniref:Chorismate synthase n=1 Tax=[Clostridium] fimetarium TaxID=99656 RepID=A0A1I0QZA6_9FIRM|nr:chorismate synthase [[Clostridium] fimetarium]SEW33026.1 chorismate synthase [[Clostridium] fimetarium]
MAGSTFGEIFRISTWGESHGKGLGVVVDGCPAGIELCEEDIQKFLDRRKPGQSQFATQRSEDDAVEIMSGIFEGKTTGTPISMIVYNKTQRSSDYSEISNYYRPGHADYTFDKKYGFRDYRGGGRSSGRETIGRVAAGAIAIKILESLNITVTAYAKSIGNIEIDYENFSMVDARSNPFSMPDKEAAEKVAEYAKQKMSDKDSIGGIIECVVKNMIPGIGEPVFEKLDANLAKAIMSIGAVKGFEIGDGFEAAKVTGLINNDHFRCDTDGNVSKESNHAGGVLGGISDGTDIIFRAAVKPTPSIAAIQSTIDRQGDNIEVSIKGRHDPIIVPRAVVVVEAMAAISLVDMIFIGMTSKIDDIVDFFNRKE